MKKELIFVGPPASGKGTQTKMLAKELNLPHVDTGSLLREAIKNSTEAGKIANGFVEKGQLVPADVVARIIEERLMESDAQNGFILDGFPRSVEQADMLDNILKRVDGDKQVDLKVLYFDIPIDNLLERIIYRRSCPACGEIFNIKTMPMKNPDKCNCCNADLVTRKDDTEEIARNRFETYFKETEPVIDFYRKRNVVSDIDAQGSVEEIFERLKKAI